MNTLEHNRYTDTWRALGAEQTANGYSVWVRHGTSDSYERWNIDSAANSPPIATP